MPASCVSRYPRAAHLPCAREARKATASTPTPELDALRASQATESGKQQSSSAAAGRSHCRYRTAGATRTGRSAWLLGRRSDRAVGAGCSVVERHRGPGNDSDAEDIVPGARHASHGGRMGHVAEHYQRPGWFTTNVFKSGR